jgi:outer membrane protein TolC
MKDLVRQPLQHFLLLTLLAVSVHGCVPVDRWQIFSKPPEDLAPTGRFMSPAFEPVDISQPDVELVSRPTERDVPVDLSVEQAVMLAFRNNRDLRVQQLSPVTVGAFERIERGQFDPELFADVEYFEERSNETSRSSGEQFDVSGDNSLAVAGVRQFIPSGTTLEAIVSQDRSISDRTPEQQTARVGLSVTQALLQGFGPAVNLASVRQAELDTLASLNELRGFAEALLADTEIAYWRYVLAREEIAIFEESLDIARKQLEEINLRIEVGILPPIEAAAAKAEEALRVQNLIDARSQLEDRRLRLLRLVSPSPEGNFDYQITTSSDPRLLPVPITDLQERLLVAEQFRPDLKEARLLLQRNRLETIVTRNGLLPKLDLFIAMGKTGYANTFSESFHNLDGNTYDLTAGVRLSHYLGNRAARGRNLAAYSARQQAAESLANLRQLVHLDVRLAVNEVERTRQQIDATRATRIFQEQTLKAEQERFDVGTSTSLQVAQSQRDLLQIQIAEVEAIVDYRIALVLLYLAEGTLLDRRGITVPETDVITVY